MGANDPTQVPPPVPGGTTPDVPAPSNPLVTGEESPEQLRARIAELEAAESTEDKADQVTVESDTEKIRRLENERDRLTAPTGVTGSSQSLPASHPDISIAAIEPGIKWGIRQGLIDPKLFGDHMVAALENGEL